ncbi:DUF962 domain-containing protein (plasmid) [Pseudoalteromonas sp. T1lg65]|uniref:Mpo1 family 2-hydroxy fatty acid dioxygenase n=1 Tax=Pseudoalteromonas sp. T1lg65 TaxID=2077101 RepID=UPI003F7B308F
MKSLHENLYHYAQYHRHKRNIFTHFFGIPMIVIALIGLCYVPIASVSVYVITPAGILLIFLCGYYIALSLRLGAIMSLLLVVMYLGVQYSYLLFAEEFIIEFYLFWLVVFVFGWVLQFVGHIYEGKKPAFVDDLMGLIIGPLFILIELLFAMGLYKQLEAKIIESVGPYRDD